VDCRSGLHSLDTTRLKRKAAANTTKVDAASTSDSEDSDDATYTGHSEDSEDYYDDRSVAQTTQPENQPHDDEEINDETEGNPSEVN
jgi:hypothetical protein